MVKELVSKVTESEVLSNSKDICEYVNKCSEARDSKIYDEGRGTLGPALGTIMLV